MVQQQRGATILVVEDDPATSEFFVDLLQFYGYHSIVAASGHEALTELAQQPMDVVLLDRRLPDMDGLEVCTQMRAAVGAELPIILLTADHGAELEAAARDAGITEYLNKPFDPQQLLQRVVALVKRTKNHTG